MSGIGRPGMMSAHRFGHRAAALYPYLNQEVQTPQGAGILLQVLAGEAHVLLYRTREKEHGNGSRTVRFRPVTSFPAAEVRPANEARRRSA